MKESTYRRQQFYALNPNTNWEDSHDNFEITEYDNPELIVEHAIRYFTTGDSYRCFPGAARAVAICSAYLVSRFFGEDFYSTLDDPNLMNGNDKYFKPYSEDKAIYDEIIAKMPKELDFSNYRMSLTERFITQEYMMDSDGLTLIPRTQL